MNISTPKRLYLALVATAFAVMPIEAAQISPELKKSADILQTILQTSFKDNEATRLSSMQLSYLSGQGLLFQASAGRSHRFSFSSHIHGVPVPPVPPVAPVAPAPDSEFEFEFDTVEFERMAEAAEEMAERIKDQHRQSYRVAEQQREIERELRDVEREKRDIEFAKSMGKLDKEQQQELQALQQKTKVLQQKLEEVSKVATQNRKQLEEQRARQLAEQQQQTAAMIKAVGETFSQVLCDYGASLRDMPEQEHVTLQLNSRGNDGRYYWVVKKADITQCMNGKIKAKDLLTKANSYQF